MDVAPTTKGKGTTSWHPLPGLIQGESSEGDGEIESTVPQSSQARYRETAPAQATVRGLCSQMLTPRWATLTATAWHLRW